MSPEIRFQVIPFSEVPGRDSAAQAIILIVDDERNIADTLSIILSRSGFATMTAYDGVSALELARTIPPDLVISDVAMPGITGIELAIRLTQVVPECKIILFSGQAETVDLLEKVRKDGYHFNTLTKPVHPKDMLRHVSESLAGRPVFSDPAMGLYPSPYLYH
jgi:DNA-binding NtrC family response regulator